MEGGGWSSFQAPLPNAHPPPHRFIITPPFTRLEELSCGVRRPTTTLHRTCTPARVRKTFKPTPARSNVTGAAYSTKIAPNTVGITEHKRQRLAGISHLGLLGLRISPMPAADASTSVAMLRRFISAVGRTSRETKRPTLTASASAPLPTSVNCSKCLINLANVTQPGFPILVVFRLKGQSKRDGSIIVRSCKASQSPVYPIRDAILAVNHVSCPSLSSSGPRQWGEPALKTRRLPGALSLLARSWL